MRYEPMPVAGYNRALEQAATAADDEANRLDALAVRKWREEELYKAGAQAARRIAITIRGFKIQEEEG